MNDTLIPSVALLVVDIQDVFLNAVPDADELLARCSFAVKAARLLQIRTFFTAQAPEKLGHVTPALLELSQTPDVFPKTAFSALRAPGLIETLKNHDIDHLIVAGVETPICIYQTAIDAANEEMAVTLLSDCITGRREADRQPVLDALARIGCHVLPAEAVFYSIVGDTDHPAFKAFTALVKKYHDNLTSRT